MKPKYQFYIGITIIAIMVITSFITIQVDSGPDYVTYTKLLSLLIFYNPFVFTLYIIIAVILIWIGIKHKVKFI